MSLRILEIDIESIPHEAVSFGIWRQVISPKQITRFGYTMCFAAKWFGERDVMFHSVWDDGMDTMVRAAWDLLNEADAIVTYNGARFDTPMLNKEFLKHGLLPPEPYHQIDLIKTVKREFRFPGGNSLDQVLRFLGMKQKMSHKGIELWIECMNDDPKALKTMMRYNKNDVRIMESLYRKLLPWIKTHPNHALYTDDTRPCCPKCGSRHLTRQGFKTTMTQKYQQFKCMKCGSWLRQRTTSLAPDKREGVLVST